MTTTHTIAGAHSVVAAPSPDGWLAGLLMLDDVVTDLIDHVEDGKFQLKSGCTDQHWRTAQSQCRRQIYALRSSEPNAIRLGSADRFLGMAVAGGQRPALLWCERQGKQQYRLLCWQDDTSTVIASSVTPLQQPAGAYVGESLLIACQDHAQSNNQVVIRTANGQVRATVTGREPRLIARGADQAALLVEQLGVSGRIGLMLFLLASDGSLVAEIPLPATADVDFHADLICDAKSGDLWIVHESGRGWGQDNRVARHCDLAVWRLPAGTTKPVPAPGTSGGLLALPRRAHFDISNHNMPTIEPRISLLGGQPVVFYRHIAFNGMRSYGWQLCTTRLVDGVWTAPELADAELSLADTSYATLPGEQAVTVLNACCTVSAAVDLEQILAGNPERHDPMKRLARDHRVKAFRFTAQDALALPEIPRSLRVPYVIPPARPDLCPEPPTLPDTPAGKFLVWGDLHAHTIYSKCMAPEDGLPKDVLQFQRDILGCRVLSIVEHTGLMNPVEFNQAYDELERFASSGCVPIYGTEPGTAPAHHINYYTIDREVFEALHQTTSRYRHQHDLFPRLISDFPPGSIIVSRHAHGSNSTEFGIAGPRVTELYTPELEVAMEAIQLRGNMMGDHGFNWPRFPSNFLNAGARIGLLGGTDHSNPAGPNRFGLTGFWVDALTPEAVFAAIRNRQTLAAANGKIAIYATVGTTPFGGVTQVSGGVTINASLAAATTIKRVCLIRDGEFLPWQEIAAKQAAIRLVDPDAAPGAHWYAVTAEAESGAGPENVLVHASPFFVTVK